MSRPLPPITEQDKAAVRQWLGAKVADRVIDQAKRDCPVQIDLQSPNSGNESTALKAAFIDGWNKALAQLYVISESEPQNPSGPQYIGEDH